MSLYPTYTCDSNFNDESRDFIVRINGEEAYVHRVYVDMHNVQPASAVMFDFDGEAEIEIECLISFAWRYKIRPESLNIKYEYNNRKIKFKIDRPVNLSIEVNDDIVHNLHIFAQKPIPRPEGREINPGIHGDDILVPDSPAILLPGVHFVGGCIMKMKENSSLYLCGGAVLVGNIECKYTQNVKIYGNGMINLRQYPRYSCLHGINIEHSKNITIDGISIVNPPHYSVGVGGSENIEIRDIKCFSCEGWSDGIDIMSSKNITIDGAFMRNSDDCIAIYGSRWNFFGNSENITVKNSSLWADVAHPTNIGGHGNSKDGGDTIKNISFENIDVLNHHEPQDDYTGVFSINAGDGNRVENISYKNVRVEQYQRGRLVDLRVCFNKTYNLIPGKEIRDVYFENIEYSGYGEMPSRIHGYSENNRVHNIHFKNVTEHGRPIKENMLVGDFAENIYFE